MKPKLTHLESNYIIKAPRSEIYKIMTDFENVPKYFPSVAKSAKYISRDGNHFVVDAQTKAFLGSKTFNVRMEGQFQPPTGFISTNTSSLGVEHEVFSMEEIPGGTKIHYVNDVEIKSPFFRRFSFLIKYVALWYWKWAVFSKLKKMLEKESTSQEHLSELRRSTIVASTGASTRLAGSKLTDGEIEQISKSSEQK